MNLAKSTVAHALPFVYFPLRCAWHRASRYGRLIRRLGAELEWRVAAGPFAGMRYRNIDPAHRPTTKLLGAYESELHSHVAAAVEARPRRVINIGCAEGYYATGFALLLPDAEVYAYDVSKRARRQCAATAKQNGVASRILLRSRCDSAELADVDEHTLIVCDIEGGECELLDPDLAPGLRRAAILVELHDFLRPTATELLISRFDASHRISIVEEARRNPACYPALERWTREDARLALDEARSDGNKPIHQHWAYLTPVA